MVRRIYTFSCYQINFTIRVCRPVKLRGVLSLVVQYCSTCISSYSTIPVHVLNCSAAGVPDPEVGSSLEIKHGIFTLAAQTKEVNDL